MAQRAQERGTDDTRRKEGAAKRNQETHADERNVARGARTRRRRSNTSPAATWEESTVRRGAEERGEQRCTKSTAHVGHVYSGIEGAAKCGARVAGRSNGKAPCSDTMPCVQKDVPQASAEVKPVASSGGRAAAAGSEGVRGPGLVRVRVNEARMQADSATQPPSATSSATSAEVLSPSSLKSPETVQQEGRRAEGQQRKDEAAAGTGEGEDKGGQAEASGGRTEVVAAEAEGQGEEQGQQAVVRRRADLFNLAELMAGGDVGQGGSVVHDILVVSEDKGEESRRIAVEGGPGQLAAPNVSAAAMKSIHPEVQRKEEGKGRRGQLVAGAAESWHSGVRAGGQGRTGKGGKGQAGASGTGHATRHQEGKGAKGGRQGQTPPHLQRLFKQSPPGSPPRVSAAVRADEERGAHRQQAAGYEALAHMKRQRCRHQPPEPGPDTIYWLEMGSGRGGSGRQGGQERSGEMHSGQPSGGLRREEGQAGQSNAAAEGNRGQREGGQESGSQRRGQAGSAAHGRVRDKTKAVRADIVGTVRKGKERDKKGFDERDTEKGDSTE